MKKNILTSLVAVVVAIALVFGMSAFKKPAQAHKTVDDYMFVFTGTSITDGSEYKNLNNWDGDAGEEEDPNCSGDEIACYVIVPQSTVNLQVGDNPRERFVNYLTTLSNGAAKSIVEGTYASSFKPAQ